MDAQHPKAALRQILADRYGAEEADAILRAYAEATRRYGRARRVQAARRWLDANAGRSGPRYDRTREIAEAIVANAEAYISGDWRPDRMDRDDRN